MEANKGALDSAFLRGTRYSVLRNFWIHGMCACTE